MSKHLFPPAAVRTSGRRGVCAALLFGVLLALGGCVEPAYLGGTPYYEERNAYYEQRPVYVQPGYYGSGSYYGGSTYYRPAPRVDLYYYDRGHYDRHDDYRGRYDRHDDYRGRDYGRYDGGGGHRDDDHGRGHDRRSDPPVATHTPPPAPQPSSSGSRRGDVQWSRPAPGTPDSEGKNSWVPRPHY